MFEVEAVSLGELSQCIVGHDGDGIGEGWYLDEILVRESLDATHEYVFTCCRSVAVSNTIVFMRLSGLNVLRHTVAFGKSLT